MAAPARAAHIVFVQTGDYAEAWQRLHGAPGAGALTGQETYVGQRRSVEFVGALAAKGSRVSVFSTRKHVPEQTLGNGVSTSGFDTARDTNLGPLMDALQRSAPTAVVLRTPLLPVVRWATSSGIAILPTLADSFELKGLKALVRNWQRRSSLNHPGIDAVANHHINASENLAAIGVERRKIVPYDFQADRSPHEFAARSPTPAPSPFTLLWVGPARSPNKGLADAAAALNELTRRRLDCRLLIAGGAAFEDAEVQGLTPEAKPRTQCLGRLPHADILRHMHQAGAVLVTSRHAYPEGLPLVIFDAFAARAPVIASDHPMFRGRVVDGHSGLIYPAGDARALADCVARLMADPALVARLSEATLPAWERLQIPLKWEDLVARWLEGPLDSAFMQQHNLDAVLARQQR